MLFCFVTIVTLNLEFAFAFYLSEVNGVGLQFYLIFIFTHSTQRIVATGYTGIMSRRGKLIDWVQENNGIASRQEV